MIENIVGKQYSRLTVIAFASQDSNRRSYWRCVCVCGTALVVQRDSLISGNTQSCGCLSRERVRARNILRTRHGHAVGGVVSSTYKSWADMKNRCSRKTNKFWKDYGGRGILVCEKWLVFDNFLADMGERPEGLSLDRIDVNGNYEPSNCRWATRKEQRSNRRDS